MTKLENMKEIAEQAVDQCKMIREQNDQLLRVSRKLIDDVRERASTDKAANE